MKNRLCFLLSGVLAAGLVLCGAPTFAQDTGGLLKPRLHPQCKGRVVDIAEMMDPDQQLTRMTKRYNLSADQQSQIKPILASQQQQMQALHGDSSMSREDRMAKMQSIHSDSNSKIEAILNADQKKQFEQDQQRMQERMQQRGQGGGPGGASAVQ